MKRIIVLILSLILFLGSFGTTAFAEGDDSKQQKRDTILMLDISSSMNGTPLDYMKVAAIKFCDQLLGSSDDNRVALIVWDDSYTIYDFSSDLNELSEIIASLYDRGLTDTAQALNAAKNLMFTSGRAEAIKNIVLLTDGLPVDGVATYEGVYTESDYSLYEYANTAYNVAAEIKEQYYLYTLGFFHNLEGDVLEFGRRFLKDLQNAGYYEVTDPNELEFRFGEVAEDITNEGLKRIEFTYGGGDTSICYFTPDYFSASSYTYNQSLGTMSIAFAMSAFGNDSEPDYANKSVNAKKLLMDIGVLEEDIETNDWFTVKPTTDSIGVIAGHRPITVNGLEYTLIAVAVRGGGYEKEWASNFTMGTEGQHEGFDTAKENVLYFLSSFIENQEITGPVKIWITGYSRAAATSNLVGGEIDNGVLLSKDISYSLDDIYVYTFETPKGARTSQVKNQPIYYNIFNIINSNDAVPYVAPAPMGFGRYGIDRYLPAKETDKDYYAKRDKMLKILNSLDNHDTVNALTNDGNFIIDEFQMKMLGVEATLKLRLLAITVDWNFILDDKSHNYSQGVFLSNYVSKISKEFLKDRNNYVNRYQDQIREICSVVFGCDDDQAKVLMDSLVSQAQENWGAFAWSYVHNVGIKGLYPWNKMSLDEREEAALQIISDWLNNAIKEAGITDYSQEMIDRAGKDLGDLALSLVCNHPNYFTTAVLNGSGIGAAHYPELCFSWMASMDPNYANENAVALNTGSYRIVRINCEVDIYVLDESGNIVAAIVDEIPQDIDDSSIISAINEDGEKMVVLPIDTTYDIQIYAREDDTVDYGIDEYCAIAGDYTRAVDYFDVSLQQGENMLGHLPAYSEDEISNDNQLVDGSIANYTLVGPDNTLIMSDSDITGETAMNAYFTVAVTSANENAGIVYGSGIRQYGNYAQIEAYADEGYEFTGWHVNGLMVSGDNIYRFRVTEDIELEAQFTEKPCYTVTFDANGGTTDVSEMNTDHNGKLDNLPTPSRSDYDFKGWFTLSEEGEEINTETVFTEDTIVFAHWDHQGNSNCNDSVTVAIPYHHEFHNKTNTPNVDDTFSYAIIATNNSPLPNDSIDGKYIFSVKGNADDSLNLCFNFSEEGSYAYKLNSFECEPKPFYTYDDSEYNILLRISRDSNGYSVDSLILLDQSGDQVERISFTKPAYENKSDASQTSIGPGTADTTKLGEYLLIMITSAMLALGLLITKLKYRG